MERSNSLLYFKHGFFSRFNSTVNKCSVSIRLSMTPYHGGISVKRAAPIKGNPTELDCTCSLLNRDHFDQCQLR